MSKQYGFEIVTDPCCGLPADLVEKHGVKTVSMSYILNGKDNLSVGSDSEETLKDFFAQMRNKASASTSCTCRENCLDLFGKILDAGGDIYYIGFSSALSLTYDVASKALEELKSKYPERKILYTDSLCAALGEGLLIVNAAQMRAAGKTIEEVRAETERVKGNVCHFFTVESLAWLYKGGRLKKSAFLLASTLNIKPVMHVDDAGHLTAVGKVFGRKASLNSLANRIAEHISEPETQTVYIGHADCQSDAEFLKSKIEEKVKVKDFRIHYLDMIVGSHAGPGTVAVFCVGKSR